MEATPTLRTSIWRMVVDGADWGAGGTSISGGSAFDSFDAFGTPGQFSPVTQTDLTVLQALGFQLSKAAVAGNLTPFPASTLATAQTTVQNTVNSPPGNSSGLDQQVALFNQFMAAPAAWLCSPRSAAPRRAPVIRFIWTCGGTAYRNGGVDVFSRHAFRRRCWQLKVLRQRLN
jgi:hypothetical protein